jgi:hypothetical protein
MHCGKPSHEERTSWRTVIRPVAAGHALTQKASQSAPLFQLVARGDPAGGDDVFGVFAEFEERRGSAVRTRY